MALAMAWTAVSGQHRLIYPMPDTGLIVKEFSIPDNWPRACGLDVRWNTAAAIWGARDPESDVLYLYSEYCGEADPAIHAAAIRSRADWIPGLIHAEANGRNQSDGYRLIKIFRDLGLQLRSVDSPLESGILMVGERMHSGRLKVFGSLSKYLDERRLYRRDERDQIVRDRDNLQDAARCLVSGARHMITKVSASPPSPPLRLSTGSMGWVR